MSSESGRNPLWYLAGIVVVGIVAWWVIKLLLGMVFYLVIGAIVVAGVMLLTRKAKRSLGNGRNREIGR